MANNQLVAESDMREQKQSLKPHPFASPDGRKDFILK